MMSLPLPLNQAPIESGSGITAPGANQDVIFNSGGVLNVDTGNLTYNVATITLTSKNIQTTNLNVSATINTAANLVAGNISTPQNTSTGNLTVTQNTITGNIIIQTTANLVTMNANGVIYANGSPLTNGITQAVTGMAAFRTSDGNSSVTGLVADPTLLVTFNEAGWYDFYYKLLINNTSNASCGFNCALSGGNTTAFATFKAHASGEANGTFTKTGIIGRTSPFNVNVVSTTTAYSWIEIRGLLHTTQVGNTWGLAWGQNTANASANTSLLTCSTLVVVKVG